MADAGWPRAALLQQLRAVTFDILVIGGGIVGAGIARDAAMRGLKVALIEQGDFASGTSSKTSKLIHGGLRYLEHGQWRLVRESLRERRILRAIAPTLVRPLTLLLPVYRESARPLWKIGVGLWLYSLLAAGQHIRPHRVVSARQALSFEPHLRAAGLRGAGVFADCQMDDARVCLANVLQAVSLGAICCNYVRLQRFVTLDGRVCGGVAEDRLTRETFEIQAASVVNAGGPWSDGIRALGHGAAAPRLAPTKGIHLILPRLVTEGVFIEARRDQRMLFLLPWGDYTLVGTTEEPVRGPLDRLAADADDVDYLLEEVNRAVVGRPVRAEDVIATYAGARPLLSYQGSATAASREHRIDVDASGLMSVMGGKFTTYRVMAQQAVDVLARQRPRRIDRCLTHEVSLMESMHPVSLAQWQEVTRDADPDLIARLLARYGGGAFHVFRLLVREPTLQQRVCPHHEELHAELAYSLRHELVCTITDWLARRTRIAWSSCQGLDALSSVAELMRVYGGVPQEQITRQMDEYRVFLANGLAFRRSAAPALIR